MKLLFASFNHIFCALRPSIQKSLPRNFTTSLNLLRSIRDEHRAGTKVIDMNSDEMTGTKSIFSINTQDLDKYLPTTDLLKQVFNGISYLELPIVHIKATRNNTLINVMDSNNNCRMYTSCRLEGFKNARKKTIIAGQTTGVAAGQKLLRRGIDTVRVVVKGIGPGRMSSVNGIASTGVNIITISDRTQLKELGPRPHKMRRV